MNESRYIIGVDLGTSNCALSYIDTYSSDLASKTLLIPQRDSESSESHLELLPSFLHLDPNGEVTAGRYAKEMTSTQSDRVIEAAKSWLCYEVVDREEKFLPWNSESVSEGKRLSPVEASARYLTHLKEAWDREFGHDEQYKLEHQLVTITVPASFDEVAQRLTLKAALLAGYPESTRLIEEPLSAFYYFLEHNEGLLTGEPALRERPLSLLVVDVGGGTSDFTIIELDRDEELRRSAVSPHLLIGGTNIDLTLAHLLEKQSGEKLSRRRWSYLLAQSRDLKERILSEGVAHERYTITIPSEGSSLFSTNLSVSITGEELLTVLLEGFFPHCKADEKPLERSGGLREWGLPFPADSAITRHLAAFVNGRAIDAVLYTGGTLKPAMFQQRLTEVIGSWQSNRPPFILPNLSMDLAVAHGAARFGLSLRERARRVTAGYSHSLYLELNQGYLCILKKGSLAGSSYTVPDRRFQATLGVPVQFQLVSSFSRPDDEVGDLVPTLDAPHRLPALQTVLERREKGEREVTVNLKLSLGETGVLALSCCEEGSEREWTLEFNLRRQQRGSSSPRDEGREAKLEKGGQEIAYYFGKKREIDEKRSPKRLFNELESVIGVKREEWPLEILRGLWPALSQGMTRRSRSLQHETTWLALAGYLLRPGYGAELDEFRVAELWRCHELGLAHPKENSALLQWWIMWRRVGGGLTKEQQLRLYREVQPLIWKQIEVLRLVGSLERIPVEEKVKIAGRIVKMIHNKEASLTEHHLWTLGRLTTRVPLYAGAQSVIPGKHIEEWFSLLSKEPWSKGTPSIARRLCTIFAHAARVTGDRSRDLNDEARANVGRQLLLSGARPEERALLDSPLEVTQEERESLFGEALPSGLRLV